MVCVAENHVQTVSVNGQGNPSTPLLKEEQKCHAAIGKGQSKLMRTIIKERSKCQTAAERAGATDTSSCMSADPNGKIAKTDNSARASLVKSCAGVAFSSLDSCSFFSLSNLEDCVLEEARVRGRLTFRSFYELTPGGAVTTTTFASTTTVGGGTTTTIPSTVQDPHCPDLGELTLLAATGSTCATNGDCLVGTCDPGLARCVTGTELDTGWTGVSHDSDINDKSIVTGNLLCPGPAPTCGQCEVAGINPTGGVCRCSNDNRQICDQPFVADANDCGGQICNCYFGAPLPLSAGNTPACIVNRFAQDISGTANVDTGVGQVNSRLASLVYLGESLVEPCPVCGGTCTAPAAKAGNPCGQDPDCDSLTTCSTNGDCANPGGVCLGSKCYFDGTCGNFDARVNDGVRGGTCFSGDNNGQSCDIQSLNTTFPAPAGGGYSLDCFPSSGKGVSGTGLKITLSQTTGNVSMSAGVVCGYPPAVSYNCPCGLCGTISGSTITSDVTAPCNSNADCTAPQQCLRRANGNPMPNQCDDQTCSATANGEGECAANSPDKFCDAVIRSNGEGFISCQSNGDCAPINIGVAAGNCTLTKQRECFVDPIVASGVPDALKPLGVAAFCVPPTANSAINTVAGLPGPGRIKNQASSRTFCAGDHAVTYQPGIGGCP